MIISQETVTCYYYFYQLAISIIPFHFMIIHVYHTFFKGGLSKALDGTANDLMKATATVTRDVSNAINSNPLVRTFFCHHISHFMQDSLHIMLTSSM